MAGQHLADSNDAFDTVGKAQRTDGNVFSREETGRGPPPF
jgi:hypothetical protein